MKKTSDPKKFCTYLSAAFTCLLLLNSVVSLYSKPKTYAIIIGISDYEDDDIPDLSYAHLDAIAFYQFLRSDAGCNVDSSNLILLVAEKAKYGEYMAAVDIIKNKIRAEDNFYFFFAGHGALENDVYSSGMLLTYDSPSFNTEKNAIKIFDVNKLANELSSKRVNVFVITDACKSGKLTANNMGNYLLYGKDLINAGQREVRMASCKSDQLAHEDRVWGGGRGLYSYFLIKGLMGEADKNADSKVTKKEISRYLLDSLEDQTKKYLKKRQTPIDDGKGGIVISTPPVHTVQAMHTLSALGLSNKKTKAITISKSDLFFDLLEQNFFDGKKNYKFYSSIEIDIFIDSIFSQRLFSTGISYDSAGQIKEEDLRSIKKSIDTFEEAKFEFKLKIAATIHNVVQQNLNAYLSNSKEELENRQIYNLNAGAYLKYGDMIDIALKAIGEGDFYNTLKMKQLYFRGLANRILARVSSNPDSLMQLALIDQEAALAINNGAAYIHNELGIIKKYFKKNNDAKAHYIQATNLVPNWILPWSNLSNLCYDIKEYDLGEKYGNKALEIIPDFNLANFALGLTSQKRGNLLKAEEYFRKAIRSNPEHYLPYYYLGGLMMKQAEYAIADSFFIISDSLRKFGDMNVSVNPGKKIEPGIYPRYSVGPSANTDRTAELFAFKDQSVLAQYIYAKYELLEDSRREFEKVLIMDPSHPLAYYYLGKIYINEGKLQEGEYYLLKAKEYHLDTIAFEQYLEVVIKDIESDELQKLARDLSYDTYIYHSTLDLELGKLYNDWENYSAAEMVYRRLICEGVLDGFDLLGNIFEKQKLFKEEEEVFRSYMAKDPVNGYYALNNFYERRIADNIEPEYYHLAIGLLLSNRELYAGNNMQVQEVISHFEAIPPKHILYIENSLDVKLGKLYQLQGNREQANEYFALALSRGQFDFGLKRIWYNNDIELLNFTDAYASMKELYSVNQLEGSALLKFIEFSILSGDNIHLDTLLDKAKNLLIVDTSFVEKYDAKYLLVRGMWSDAMDKYEAMLNKNPTDPYISYTLFRMYALFGEYKQADKYLGLALNNGIARYMSLLRHDEYVSTRVYDIAYRFINLFDHKIGSNQ